jgi:hypothetical protein
MLPHWHQYIMHHTRTIQNASNLVSRQAGQHTNAKIAEHVFVPSVACSESAEHAAKNSTSVTLLTGCEPAAGAVTHASACLVCLKMLQAMHADSSRHTTGLPSAVPLPVTRPKGLSE